MLKGKVAVITGGTRGIGFTTVKKFLENGATVVLFGSREETVNNVHFLEEYLKQGLDRVHDLYPDFFTGYTQRGIIFGLEFDFEEGGQHAMRALFNHGIWAIYARFNPKIVQFKPGLLCTKEYCDELLEKFEASVKEAKEVCDRLR